MTEESCGTCHGRGAVVVGTITVTKADGTTSIIRDDRVCGECNGSGRK